MACELLNPEELSCFIETWFKNSARPLPWRIHSSAWGRLVSEFMSQQTQITRVAERWPEMMERFPTPERMAKSSEQEVLTLWQGLGYYRRAKHLKKTAEMICERFNGKVPHDVESLLKLPGIGKYTAGAIASIAFGSREPIVDGNVHRVLCRVFNHSDDHHSSTWTWKESKRLVENCQSPAVFNEGLMELGATVCTPKKPKCECCPLQEQCLAFKNNTQFEVPAPKKSVVKKRMYHYSVIVECKNEIAIEKRSEQGLWAGMWQVPTVESSKGLTESQVANKLQLQEGLQHRGEFEHVLSHRIISFTVFSCQVTRDSRFSWINQEEVDNLPLASAQRKVLALHCEV